MKIEIETGGNGIHHTYSISANEIRECDLEFLNELVKIVEKYQKEALDHA